MNNMKNRLIDFFSKTIYELYEVTDNQARFLFDRWNIIELDNENNIKNFLNNDDVKNVFYIAPDVNIAKKYTLEELHKLKINLSTTLNNEERIYKDDRYGFTWQEVFNGMADSYTGLYKIKEPVANDFHLCKK